MGGWGGRKSFVQCPYSVIRDLSRGTGTFYDLLF